MRFVAPRSNDNNYSRTPQKAGTQAAKAKAKAKTTSKAKHFRYQFYFHKLALILSFCNESSRKYLQQVPARPDTVSLGDLINLLVVVASDSAVLAVMATSPLRQPWPP